MSCFLKIELSPELIRLVERIAGGFDPAMMARIEDHMATTRELLDALRKGVEADESRRAEIARLKQEAEDARAAEEIEDAEELEELAEEHPVEHGKVIVRNREFGLQMVQKGYIITCRPPLPKAA